MFVHKSVLKSMTGLFALAVLASCAAAPPRASAPAASGAATAKPTISVVLVYGDKAFADTLISAGNDYLKNTGIGVNVTTYNSDKAIEHFNDMKGRGESLPDIIIAPFAVGRGLLDKQILAPYCDDGTCQKCQQPIPPQWCPVASKSHASIGISAGSALCPDGGGQTGLCKICLDPSVVVKPPFCKTIKIAKDDGWASTTLKDLDILQLSVLTARKNNKDIVPIPYGTPCC